MQHQTNKIYTREVVQQLDQLAIQKFHISGWTLMQRAGKSAFEYLLATWQRVEGIAVFCGVGNNGGDGYVLAGLAKLKGLDVAIYQVGDRRKIYGAAKKAMETCDELKIPVYPWRAFVPAEHMVVVDAIFGTGLNQPLQGEWLDVIQLINATQLPTLSMDIPSGLDANRGVTLGAAVKAEVTVTFIGIKQGLLTGQARDYTGQVILSDLGLPPTIYNLVRHSAEQVSFALLKTQLLHQRSRCAHKGHFGHILILGGQLGMGGAVKLAGEAALRTGVGLVSIGTRQDNARAILSQRAELMCYGLEEDFELTCQQLIEKASVILLGPGLGQDKWSQQLFHHAIHANKSMVIDADGLNLLAHSSHQLPENCVLTPHPGEAARLLQMSVPQIEEDRFQALSQLVQRYHATVVLKGAGTLIEQMDGVPAVCTEGNAGMATAGMGDVLSGVIASFMAQGLSTFEAATLGVCVHAYAADQVALTGERGMIASDVCDILRQILN